MLEWNDRDVTLGRVTYLCGEINIILPGNQRNGIAGPHGRLNKTVIFRGCIAASLRLASDHFDSLHMALLKHRPRSY
jgi:hypothetical protein